MNIHAPVFPGVDATATATATTTTILLLLQLVIELSACLLVDELSNQASKMPNSPPSVVSIMSYKESLSQSDIQKLFVQL